MIKYKLVCKNCNLSFDSWFASSKEYEKLKRKKLINCHKCSSQNVEKTLMAPKLINKISYDSSNKELQNLNNIKKKIKEYQKFIKNNFEYVGKNFAYELGLFITTIKKKIKVFMDMHQRDLKELKEEGIDTQLIPWIQSEDN